MPTIPSRFGAVVYVEPNNDDDDDEDNNDDADGDDKNDDDENEDGVDGVRYPAIGLAAALMLTSRSAEKGITMYDENCGVSCSKRHSSGRRAISEHHCVDTVVVITVSILLIALVAQLFSKNIATDLWCWLVLVFFSRALLFLLAVVQLPFVYTRPTMMIELRGQQKRENEKTFDAYAYIDLYTMRYDTQYDMCIDMEYVEQLLCTCGYGRCCNETKSSFRSYIVLLQQCNRHISIHSTSHLAKPVSQPASQPAINPSGQPNNSDKSCTFHGD